ncbi:hypothetical protein [Actinomycetospora sp. NBRC 106378]|jgi:hypothetical protein|uniref:hypothetical protein n=1 Tax=Actinomycetospora sp. NBRC 106378 TaxID=3032208 RepID=UPI0024A3D20A|nr:hypothetical protein [Actinomycetospora sp. NBRC 106378]GLZ56046.1 hypothetical protein Acsp07_56630 [Actinomycetospora sp. NBRC 106378]
MSTLRRTVLATAVISTGLVSSAGMAFAGDNPSGDHGSHHGHHHGDVTVQKGLINSSDFAPNTALNLCNNNVPVNVAGIQVPLQDNILSLPILSGAKHGNAASSSKSCSSPIDAVN